MEPVNACVEDLIEPGYQIIPYGMIDSHVKDMSYMKHFSYSAVAIRLVLVGFLCKTQNKTEKRTNTSCVHVSAQWASHGTHTRALSVAILIQSLEGECDR